MTTQSYYKDRLGFDPNDPREMSSLDPTLHGYEENLSKFKDERDAIQKKTFTKWVNKHLRKIGRRVDDLFEDLRDGHNLVSLLEVLSGDHLPRERGQMRFHMLQNVQTSLDYLRYRKIKLVNIRAEDIVDSNPKLTLGLIWTIILHFQISDIMVGQDESLTAREALLRWAQRTTAKYPGVRVKDFTSSWKDGLAFNAIIHRNRPDLVDWRSLKNRGIRDRLESAFNIVEREYGVTRLLDPEDVDTPEPDEKSLITYISSLYDVFPNPPALHPLYDPETQRKYSDYRELSSSLHVWIRESTLLMQDRNFPNTLIEVKKLALESNRFRTDEVPPRLREKQHITRLYKDIEKFLEETEEKLEPELRPDVLERNWNQLLLLHQERDAAIHKEMERLERLQRIAEKVHREAKQSDVRLDDIEARIDEEAKRLDRLHPRDAMKNCEVLNSELASIEEAIKNMFSDVQILKEGRYNQTADLHKRVQRIHQRWQSIRAVFQTRLLEVLPSLTSPDASRSSRSSLEARLFETNEQFRFLRECSEWVRSKLTQMEKAAYGSDLPSVQIELESHLKEHKSVDKFQSNVEKCISNKNKFQGEESAIYVHHVTILQKSYTELTMTSKKRLADLEMLQDFIQSATTELIWLNEKEEIEISRDWSSKSLNVTEIERYYEALMSELEKREIQVSAVQDRGEALVLQHHPASKCVEAYMTALSTQWKWLLQLTLCLETHLRHAAVYHNFFTEVQKCEQWCIIQDQLLNSTYSQSEFTLDEGEKLLKEMQDLREDLSHYSSVVEALYERSREVVPLKQRRSSLRQPIAVTSICIYKQVEVSIGKDEVCKLVNNSSKTKWKVVTSNGVECQVPSVCLLIPPPDPEAAEAADRLKRQYDRCEALWLKKQMRMSQNMIFATIKVVKSWDLSQFMAMGKDQRDAIRKALNEDAEKLLQQGDPNDPQLRRLQREIDEVNQLFDEFERRAAMGNRPELSQRAIGDQLTTLLVQLEESERTLTSRITAPLPRDLDQLEQLVVEHKHFETELQSLQPELESAKENVEACPRKTPSMQTKLDTCITKWNMIWQNSNLYIERLKGTEIVLNGLDESTKFVSRLEIQLASCENMPAEPEALRKVHDDLVDMQSNIQMQQGVIDQLAEEAGTVRQLVIRSRSSVNATIRKHPDVDRLEAEVKTIITRWSNICTQVVERLQSCETTFEHLERYSAMSQVNHTWIDATSETVSKLPPVENGVQAKDQLDSTAKLYNGVAAKKPSLDEANILGARLIREAKIYDIRLKSYRTALEEFQPSWDGIVQTRRGPRGPATAAEYVARDLDDLNGHYEELVDALQRRLQLLCDMAQQELDEFEFDVGCLAERPVVHTYLNELHLCSNSSDNDESHDDGDMPSIPYSPKTSMSSSPPRRSSITTVYIDSEQQMSTRVSTTTLMQQRRDSGNNGRMSAESGRRLSQSIVTSSTSSMSSATASSTCLTQSLSSTPHFANRKTGQQLTLMEAIQTGLLDVQRGAYMDPVTGNVLTLSEAASQGLVDPTAASALTQPSLGLKDPRTGQGISLMQAIQLGLYDAGRGGFVHPQTREPVSAEEALLMGLLLRDKQAMEERYKLCDDGMARLLVWISNVEAQLANQDTVREDVAELKNQINVIRGVRDDLESHSRPVNACLDQVRQIVSQGGEFLSADEINTLEAKGQELKKRYDNGTDQTEKLLRKVSIALDELHKFRTEITNFKTWMVKSNKLAEEKERQLANLSRVQANAETTREFVSDVIAHQADLRFITMAAQKFVDESMEYLVVLNDFRDRLPQRLRRIEPSELLVKAEVVEVTEDYQTLMKRANKLSDKMSDINSKHKDYQDIVTKAKAWLKEVEPKATKIVNEPLGAEPKMVEDQLGRAKALNNDVVANERLVNHTVQAAASLLTALDGDVSEVEKSNLQSVPADIQERYKKLLDALADKCQFLDNALVQSQGVQEALDSLANWLSQAENQLKTMTRPTSLNKDRLDEQLREHRVLVADIESHRPSFESINEAAAALIANPDNARVARKIEAKMKDMNSRYEKLQDKVYKRGYVLEEIAKSLDSFINSVSQFDDWYQQVWEILDSSDQEEADQLGARIEDISRQKDQRREDFDNMLQNGRTLVVKKDIADATPIREKIKTLEMQWKDLSTVIDQSLKDGKARTDQLNTYEKLRDQVLEWLTKNEARVDTLEPVAVDADILKRQTDELRPIMKEFRDYETTISRVADLGYAYENMTRLVGDGSRKSSIASPSKRASITTLRRSSQDVRRPSQDLRRQSQDLRSPSPIKVGMGALPINQLISSVASSGFNSRRSSQDFYGSEDSSVVEKQIKDINDRYSQLLSKVNDRKAELELMTEEAKKHTDALRTLVAFLDKVERQLPRDSAVPQTRDDAEKQLRSVKNVLEDMYDKQPQLDTLKTQVSELLRRKSGVPGADALQDQMMSVSGRWKDLQDRCKARSKFLEDVKDFHDTHDQLSAWLTAKDRMMSVLGPISSDPRLVHHQLQQVQVLREEFKAHEPQVQHLERLADSILEIAEPNSNDGRKVNDKVVSISAKWSDLIGRLEERKQNLDAASGTSRQFYASLGQLQDALQKISDNLEELAVENVYPEEILKHLEDLQDQLEGQRPLIAGLETVGEQLCAVLSDASSKAEVAQKLSQIDKMHAQLQKKLDNRRAELENLLKDNREFEDQCGQLQEWLGDCARLLVDALQVSADRDILRRQLQDNEPAYKDVMDKEHEVIMMLDKGQELANQSPNKNDAKAFNKLLERIRGDWNKVRQETVSRHRRLQTCMELCRKYDGSQETFIPWLDQAEEKLNQMQPVAFKKSDLDAQVKELQSFRNDMSRHSATFETNKSLGESFLSACDIDKDGVKSELTTTKQRWDQINAAVLERSQSLEDIAQRLAEFIELLRDSQHAMQRCEDRLSSHDALGAAARDSRLLDRIRTLLDEAVLLEKGVDRVQQYASGLVADAASHESNASHIQDQADDLARRYSELRAQLEDRCNMLETASVAVLQFNEHVKAVLGDLSTLESELDSMAPAGRDLDTLNNQLDQTNHFLAKLEARQAEVEAIATDGQSLVSEGHAPDAQGLRDQLDSLRKQTSRLEDRGKNRLDELEKTLIRVESFYDLYSNIMQHIDEASNEERAFKPIVGDVELVRQQQEEFRSFKQELIIPLGQNVEEANRGGQGLVQSAANGVSTTALESDLEKMNDRWNNLKEKLNDRERRLDVAFLQSGKFQEALQGLSKWLSDTEEMVANQKPPSADYKVVKAQLQEQKFLKKLLLDRQQSMSSLLDMGQDIANHAHPEEQAEIEEQLQELVARFDALTNGADDRMDALEKAMAVAKEFQDKFSPIADWLEKMERKIKEMEIVPTDEEKIQQRIEEHDLLHDDILSKKPAFDGLTDIATNLMSLVGEEEAGVLADRLTELTDRYGALVENSEALGRLLSDAKSGLRHLVLSYEDLLAWMESMESKLFKYRILSVHVEKLQEQMEELMYLTEEVAGHQPQVESVVDTGLELMRHITNEEALQLKEKLDSVQRRYTDLTGRADDLLKHAQETLPLVEQFHSSHNGLANWLLDAEDRLQALDSSSAASGGSAGLDVQESIIARLENELAEVRPFLDTVNQSGPQLCQRCPGEGSAYIESLITRDNRRFDAICEQIQRKAERLHLSKQRSMEVVGDLDELLDWFHETEQQLREADPPSSDPEVIRVQLKEHKVIGDEISTQKGRVRDILSAAQKVLRESPQTEDSGFIREKMEDLKETRDRVSELSADRLSILEQALPLAEHFYEAHSDLSNWLGEIEEALANLDDPAIRPEQIVRQQEGNKLLMAEVAEHKPLFDKLNKTGTTLAKLCIEEEGVKVHDILESDNSRYAALRSGLRERQQALEEALQETSQFSDKLDGMLAALANAFEQVKSAEPVSAHPDKIQEQMQENQSVVEDLEKRESAFEAVKRAADEVIVKNPSDPAVKDIEGKLKKLSKLWDTVVSATGERGKSLEEALAVAERFWEELQAVMTALKELQETLVTQEPPAVEPAKIHQQQATLQDIKTDIEHTKPEVEHCRQVGQELINLCGEPDKPEVKKHIEELDSAWDNITALYAKREENLIDAMEKAMEYHDTLNSLIEFLEKAEKKFHGMRPLGTDIETVKEQIEQLKAFKAEVDPQMVKVETLNRSLHRQAADLADRTSPDQAARLKEPLAKVNRRWEDLLRGVVDRQRELEHALLRLGQFQHALNELLVWIQRTDSTLDELKPVFGDPSVIEVELAKLKVLINDIQAHQTSVDTLNDAGRQLVETDKGSDDSNKTQQRLVLLNKKWGDLVEKASNRQKELEDALREAQQFTAEIQDLLLWLNDIDGALSMSKPVGGLPETASDQLQRFMEVYHELEKNRPLVESCLQRGADYLKRSTDGAASSLQHNLRTLKQRWDNVMNRANDKKIKLEIALKEATEFHDALQAFIDWLTNAEKTLGGLKPASRVMETVLSQIEEHKTFQKDIAAQREVMLSLDKKGTHLKYFSQKQDVILIKNLLISVQHRWERVLSRAAERTRALDHAYKEAKEYHDSWHELYSWLDEAEKGFDDAVLQLGKDPEKIKQLLAKHKEFQRTLGAKQPTYDGVVRLGKLVKDRAPKTDEPTLKQMMSDLKAKWQSVCNKSVDRQRKLEEGLLFSGQFKDAIQALVDWLCKTDPAQMMEGPVHGDLDTVMALREQHKNFEEELHSRLAQTKQVRKMAVDVMSNASEEDRAAIQKQVSELDVTWENVSKASNTRSARLDDALAQAETLHKAVNMLLEWLSDAEMKLRFAGALPDEEPETLQQLADHHKFLEEVIKKEADKDDTLALAQDILGKAHPDAVSVIRHWITIIQSRWEEVMAWANQREHRLNEHLRNLREMASILEELLAWLSTAEKTLITLEAETLPDDLPIIEGLIKDHQEFMEDMAKRQPEVDRVCKTKQPPRNNQPGKIERKPSRNKSTTSVPDREFSQSPTRESSPEHDTPARRPSRVTPDRENSLIPRLVRPSYKPQSRESTPGPQQQSRKPSQATSPSPARDGSPSRDYPKPWMVGASRSSPGREKTPDNYWPHIGPRFAPSVTPVTGNSRKGSKVSVEVLPRNPRARQLWDRWRNVWMMAWDRQRRLQDKLNYLQELEKVKNFSWDDWRRRFMKYMNNKKSRVTDLFRKMDKNNEGFIPREDFIDGIMKTKFPTSRMEMNAVANMFDRNNEGYIDWKEFLAALRPDWEERPTTEDEIIHDEVKRAVNQCTCRNRFKVHQVGEGQYRFGDSQKLRLVRILRSTVMVRVGGGWVALDEFLVKNDPCRVVIIPHLRVRTPGEHEFWCPFFSKGRTNLELREQFILPEGASQGMTPFKPRASPNSSVSSQPGTGQMVVSPLHARSPSLPTAGPITKVRERTVRSSPMRPSFSAGTPDSSVSESDGSFHLHGGRKASAPPRTMTSGGGSHSGSRPASRNADSKHGSIQSLDSYDGGYAQKTPTGIRRTPSFQRPDSAARHQPGSSSTLPRKRSTIPSPVETRARHPSSSSASGMSPSPSGGLNGGAISAASRSRILRTASASNIPVLTSTPSRSRIPIYVGVDSEDGTRARHSITASHRSSLSTSRPVSRTPSTSNIPVLTTPSQRGRTASGSSGTGIPGTPGTMRREGTSDSMSGIARKVTSTGIRKPSGTPTSRPSPK
ncbi:microtubule-actin cross-linking factor 1-like isoform X3 [Daphnia pulex]|uniref:microtubule-actin cross-linking factor 1-like isoform X3 n=1 Tax=Daphnia pulex TaxID=6669 RepID=UPI001EE11FAC|nr:microtubule-actin cross-linking factor 1-like isoform X3 [Daphnia pulex]